jgi:hypothetical protein
MPEIRFKVEPIPIKDMEVQGDDNQQERGQDQEALKGHLDISKGHFNRRVGD